MTFLLASDLVFVTTPDDVVAVAGSMTTLMCAAASSSNLTLYWTKNGVNILLPGAVDTANGLTRYDLLFSSLVADDSGNYECSVRSDFYRQTITSSATLVVFGEL